MTRGGGRRITLEAPDGRVVVRDLSRPGARLLDLDLPDGERVMIAEHLCGWAAGDDPAPGDRLWPTIADAVRALTGRTRDGESWISVLEEFATGLGAPAGEPLDPADEARLAELRLRVPSCHVDGPRAHHSGGWYMFVGGLPGGAWVMEYGESAREAAGRALLKAEALAGGDADDTAT